MVFEVPLNREGFLALGALERPVSCVHSLMHEQIIALSEHSLAYWAFETKQLVHTDETSGRI